MKTISHCGKNQIGLTLVELMIVMVLSVIVVGATYLIFQAQSRSAGVQAQVIEMQQNLRSGLAVMLRELRMIGYDPSGNCAGGNFPFQAANATAITFNICAESGGVDDDNDGTVDENGEMMTLKYSLYDYGGVSGTGDGDTDLGRRNIGIGETAPSPIAENIEGLEFNYVLQDGTSTTSPTTTELSNIRSIGVSILARSDRADDNFLDTAGNYTALSGAVLYSTNSPPAAADNHYRRRLATINVRCRNMGLD